MPRLLMFLLLYKVRVELLRVGVDVVVVVVVAVVLLNFIVFSVLLMFLWML